MNEESGKSDFFGRPLPEHVPAFRHEHGRERTILFILMFDAGIAFLGGQLAINLSTTRRMLDSWSSSFVPIGPGWVIQFFGLLIATLGLSSIAARIKRINRLKHVLDWHGWRATANFLLMNPRAFREYFKSEVWVAELEEPRLEFGLWRWALQMDIVNKRTGTQKTRTGQAEAPTRVDMMKDPEKYRDWRWVLHSTSFREELARADHEGVFIRSTRSRAMNNLSMISLAALPFAIWLPMSDETIIRDGDAVWLVCAGSGALLVAQSVLVVRLLLEGTGKTSFWWQVARNNGYGFLVMRFVTLFSLLIGSFSGAYWVLSTLEPMSFNASLSKVDSIYFTLTTFTTTGFGDIQPATQISRILVSLQMIFGFFAVSIGVAAALARASWMPPRTDPPLPFRAQPPRRRKK
ncbi:ion channel [Pengzhenrongella phosphoraccumulans]|uniref:ion channel n=1 Tax=Pengzhenrongella phosphoraccumulans TaxID=3114394 RepID=UPI0038902BF4